MRIEERELARRIFAGSSRLHQRDRLAVTVSPSEPQPCGHDCGTAGFVARRGGYSHVAMTEPTLTVLPDPPLEPRRPGEPPTVDIPEPPDPAEPWNEPEPPEPPTPRRPPELPPDDDL